MVTKHFIALCAVIAAVPLALGQQINIQWPNHKSISWSPRDTLKHTIYWSSEGDPTAKLDGDVMNIYVTWQANNFCWSRKVADNVPVVARKYSFRIPSDIRAPADTQIFVIPSKYPEASAISDTFRMAYKQIPDGLY